MRDKNVHIDEQFFLLNFEYALLHKIHLNHPNVF